MRVLMTADVVGGVWRYATELIHGLDEQGVEVVLAVSGGETSSEQQQALEASPVIAWEERSFRLEWMSDPWADVHAAGSWLRDLALRYEVDLVHLNGFSHGSLDWHLPVLVAAHSDVVSWWRGVHGSFPPTEWDTYRVRVEAGLRGADHVVAPTNATLEDLRVAFDFTTRTSTIPNGIAANEWEASPGGEIVLTAGRLWDEAKNARAVVEVADALPWKVVLAGTLDADLDMGPNVEAVGHLDADDLRSWMQRASIFVAPARYEPFGLTALEAALSGCALVVGDIPSLREVWGDSAIFVSDQASLAEALQDLIGDPERLRSAAAAATARAATYTRAAMTERYVDTYRELLREPAVSAR